MYLRSFSSLFHSIYFSTARYTLFPYRKVLFESESYLRIASHNDTETDDVFFLLTSRTLHHTSVAFKLLSRRLCSGNVLVKSDPIFFLFLSCMHSFYIISQFFLKKTRL